jgi:serine/threonine-protein kinase HipA
MADHQVEVVVQLAGTDVLAGRMWSHRGRGDESATFSYATDYLARRDAYELDPLLPLVAGQQQTPAGRAIFGAFSDSAPERWGRRLIQRAERRRARHDHETERSFGEIDYLVGVRDDLRQGALRFRDPETGGYLADERAGIPHLVALPELLSAAERLERDEAGDAEIDALLHGGSSLGGARPKAHVLDGAGRVAIAKFPSPANDDWDVMRWEAVALTLAEQAGIAVPDFTLHAIGKKAVLIVDRFDRRGDQRIGYVSAMTMLEATDGDGGSYLDIADVVERHSPTAGEDLRQLWRRIAFSILISNTDDHLRNHGFLRTSTAGWALSPAFDVNPDPRPGAKHLSTAIDYDSTAARIDTAIDVAEYFRLTPDDARAVLRYVVDAVDRWRTTARQLGLGGSAIEQMEPAFEHRQADVARAAAKPAGEPGRRAGH